MSTSGVSMSRASAAAMIGFEGDPAAEIAALAVQSGSEQKKLAHAERDAAECAEVSEDAQQITALHAKADDLRAQATESMVGGVLGGAFEIAGGGVGLGGGEDAASTSKMLDGAGKLYSAEGAYGAGTAGAGAVDHDATAAAHAQAADMAKHRADDARDDAKDAGEAANKAIDWLRDYESARSAATQAALHRA